MILDRNYGKNIEVDVKQNCIEKRKQKCSCLKKQKERKYLSKITEIENAIIQLGPGEFQKFCDTFLSQKHYGKITGLGMKSGTLKTTIGNPDTYFRKENGKYI